MGMGNFHRNFEGEFSNLQHTILHGKKELNFCSLSQYTIKKVMKMNAEMDLNWHAWTLEEDFLRRM